jgi:putative flippase GtrA
LNNTSEIRRFLLYGMVGTFVTAMKLGTLFTLRDLLGVVDFWSISISYMLAVLLHYFLNKHITFAVRDRQIVNLMTLKYLGTLLLAYLIYTTNIFLMNRVLGLPFYGAVGLSLGISFVVNYLLYQKLVFVRGQSTA